MHDRLVALNPLTIVKGSLHSLERADVSAAEVRESAVDIDRQVAGLGLAIARKVIEALGGSIRMESREGEGTRVEIELPMAPSVGTRAARGV